MEFKTIAERDIEMKSLTCSCSSVDAEGGGGEEHMDSVSKFLNQIPPNWEMAEKHGTANLAAINGQRTTLNLGDKDSYCPCCNMPYPTEDDHWYSLCCDNMELGSMGSGYPLFFEFQKLVGYLMGILTLIYFAPIAYMIYDAIRDFKGNLKPDDSKISLFSIGAFIMYVGDKNYSFLDYNKRVTSFELAAMLVMLSIFISFIYLIWLRANLFEKAIKLDDEALTPSDFCLMGTHMRFDNYSPKAVEEEISKYMKEKFDCEIIYCN